MKKKYAFDVALSFAGEDNDYVRKVATFLYKQNIKVFYAGFEEFNLWGKDLYTYLSDVYKDQAKYTVMFISEFYAKKLWTNHERKNAQARAFNENYEYILPARFDNTKIPGVLDTIGYIKLDKLTPNDFGLLICKKLNPNFSISSTSNKKKAIIKKISQRNDLKNERLPEGSLNHIQSPHRIFTSKFRFVNIGQSSATQVSNMVVKLNSMQTDLEFKYSSDVIEPDKKKKLKQGVFFDEYFHELLINYMHKNRYSELPIGITSYPLINRLYSSCYRESAILSVANWTKFCKYPISKGLMFLTADAIMSFFLNIAPHEDYTVGCPSDYCDNLSDINIGIEKANYCDQCKRLILFGVENNQIPISTVASIYRLLDEVADRTVCFVITPFDKKFEAIYLTIKDIATGNGFYCSRYFDMPNNSILWDTNTEMMIRSELLIIDITGKNPDVFYKLGYAHSLGKNAIILTQDPNDVPYDLRSRKYILYENILDLTQKLKAFLGSYKRH
jgi:hypothetical protein